MKQENKEKWNAVLKVLAAIVATLLGIFGADAANEYLG